MRIRQWLGAMPDVRARLVEGGLDPIVSTPEEFGEFIRAEIAKWLQVAKDVGSAGGVTVAD